MVSVMVLGSNEIGVRLVVAGGEWLTAMDEEVLVLVVVFGSKCDEKNFWGSGIMRTER